MVLIIKLGWQGWMEVIKNENLLMRIFSPWAWSCQYFLLDTLLTPVSSWVCSRSAHLEVLATQLWALTEPKSDNPEDSSLSSPACHTPAVQPPAVIPHHSETSKPSSISLPDGHAEDTFTWSYSHHTSFGAGVPAAEGILVRELHCSVSPKALPWYTAVLCHSKDFGLLGSLAVHVIYCKF